MFDAGDCGFILKTSIPKTRLKVSSTLKMYWAIEVHTMMQMKVVVNNSFMRGCPVDRRLIPLIAMSAQLANVVDL